MIGVGAGILLLLFLRRRKNTDVTTLDGGVGAGDMGDESQRSVDTGSIGGGGFGGGSVVGGSPINTPVATSAPVNTLRPAYIPQRPATSPVNTSRPATSLVDSRPATSPVNTSQVNLRSNFLTFDGSFRSPSNLDFDGSIID